jgi:heme oxygenase
MAMHAVRQLLREATGACHKQVDAAFADFDLTDAGSYRAFLAAHARVLPAAEQAIGRTLWNGWMPRAPILLVDLAELGIDPPAAFSLPSMELSERWGALYVLEGSRLGGVMLAGRVGSGLPVRYLSAGHGSGSWQAFQVALEAAVPEGGLEKTMWLDKAVVAATTIFGLFEQAAALELGRLRER